MAFIEWQPKYSVKIPAIDEQHRGLIAMINELHEAMRKGKSTDVMASIVGRLVRYTREHFAREEHMMLVANYPGYAAHKRAHEKLIAQVVDLEQRLARHEVGVAITAMDVLRTWLTEHILEEDQAYVPAVTAATAI
jgi:hemerythrin